MSKRWVANVCMLCPAVYRKQAATVAASFSANPFDDTPKFFSREVGEIGKPEVTHYLAHSRIREQVLAAFPALPLQFPGALYQVTSHDDFPEKVYPTVRAWLLSLGLELKDEKS